MHTFMSPREKSEKLLGEEGMKSQTMRHNMKDDKVKIHTLYNYHSYTRTR